MVKEFFEKNNIDYEEVNVAADPSARQELIDISGQMAVPVTMLDQQIVIGFDQNALEEIIKGA